MNECIRRATLAAVICLFALSSRAAARVEHVFIISIDGGKPAVIQQSQMPVLERMVGEGACTWTANTIFPSITLPSHTSMLSGVGPKKHKILWNKWLPTNGIVRVPTVFSLAKQAGYSTAMFVGKEKFRHLLLPGSVDQFEYSHLQAQEVIKTANGGTQDKEGTVLADEVAREAAAYILRQKPNLCFIHFADPDVAGHKYGWGSPQQIKSLASTDAALGLLMKAIDQAGIADQTVILLSADHGGHAKTHGGKSDDDMHIPWIAWGKGVKHGFALTDPVTTFDTAATALWLLDVPRPASFDGHAVTSSFEPSPLDVKPIRSFSSAVPAKAKE